MKGSSKILSIKTYPFLLPIQQRKTGKRLLARWKFLLYKSPFSDEKIHKAFGEIELRSIDFQKALLELAYTNYPRYFFSANKKIT